MAFNNIGSFTIRPGQSLRIDGWTFNGGQDVGAQYFSADPIYRHPNLPSDFMLIMSDQSKYWVGTYPDGHVELRLSRQLRPRHKYIGGRIQCSGWGLRVNASYGDKNEGPCHY